MFIINLQHLQKYVKVNKDFDMEAFEAYHDIALNKYFSFMNLALIANLNSYSASTAGTPERTAYELWMGALCRLSMFEYTSTGEIQIGAEGIIRFEIEGAKTAYKGQIKRLRDDLEDTAFMEINKLVKVLNANTGIFTDWPNSPGSLLNSKHLIKTSEEFSNVQKLYREFSTFMILVPDMKIQQDLYLSSIIESTILAAFISNTSTDAKWIEARSYAVTALVQFTIARGIKTGLVKLSSSGVQVIEEDYNTANALAKQANLNASAATIREFEDTGHRYINKCIEFLQNNPSDFPTQPVPTTSTKPKNSFRA